MALLLLFCAVLSSGALIQPPGLPSPSTHSDRVASSLFSYSCPDFDLSKVIAVEAAMQNRDLQIAALASNSLQQRDSLFHRCPPMTTATAAKRVALAQTALNDALNDVSVDEQNYKLESSTCDAVIQKASQESTALTVAYREARRALEKVGELGEEWAAKKALANAVLNSTSIQTISSAVKARDQAKVLEQQYFAARLQADVDAATERKQQVVSDAASAAEKACRPVVVIRERALRSANLRLRQARVGEAEAQRGLAAASASEHCAGLVDSSVAKAQVSISIAEMPEHMFQLCLSLVAQRTWQSAQSGTPATTAKEANPSSATVTMCKHIRADFQLVADKQIFPSHADSLRMCYDLQHLRWPKKTPAAVKDCTVAYATLAAAQSAALRATARAQRAQEHFRAYAALTPFERWFSGAFNKATRHIYTGELSTDLEEELRRTQAALSSARVAHDNATVQVIALSSSPSPELASSLSLRDQYLQAAVVARSSAASADAALRLMGTAPPTPHLGGLTTAERWFVGAASSQNQTSRDTLDSSAMAAELLASGAALHSAKVLTTAVRTRGLSVAAAQHSGGTESEALAAISPATELSVALHAARAEEIRTRMAWEGAQRAVANTELQLRQHNSRTLESFKQRFNRLGTAAQEANATRASAHVRVEQLRDEVRRCIQGLPPQGDVKAALDEANGIASTLDAYQTKLEKDAKQQSRAEHAALQWRQAKSEPSASAKRDLALACFTRCEHQASISSTSPTDCLAACLAIGPEQSGSETTARQPKL